jgi:hypothetical protein
LIAQVEAPHACFAHQINLDAILVQLKQQRDQLNAAIAALEVVTGKKSRNGRTDNVSLRS